MAMPHPQSIDYQVVEQLAIALSTIEDLEKACDFHIRACELNDGRVRDLTRKVEDLANDRAAADAEAAKLRQQLEASRADAKLAHTASTKATSDICGLQGQLWTQNGNVDRLKTELAEANRKIDELRGTLELSVENTRKAIELLDARTR
jgi:predicted RNase H-like nuclease (RuvC/YqgF family)